MLLRIPLSGAVCRIANQSARRRSSDVLVRLKGSSSIVRDYLKLPRPDIPVISQVAPATGDIRTDVAQLINCLPAIEPAA